MAIWLGKQYLDQKDQVHSDISDHREVTANLFGPVLKEIQEEDELKEADPDPGSQEAMRVAVNKIKLTTIGSDCK